MTRKDLARQLEQADANSVQADKDGRVDAAFQWRKVALEISVEIATFEKNRLSDAIRKLR